MADRVDHRFDVADREREEPLGPGKRELTRDALPVGDHGRAALHQDGEPGRVRRERHEVGQVTGGVAQQEREAAHQLASLSSVGRNLLRLSEQRTHDDGIGRARRAG